MANWCFHLANSVFLLSIEKSEPCGDHVGALLGNVDVFILCVCHTHPRQEEVKVWVGD